MANVTLRLALLMATLMLARPADAGVLFSRTGDDLLVDIQAPVTLIASENSSTALYGIVFEDVFGLSVTDTARVTPPEVTSTMTIGASTNTHYGNWGHQTFPQGVIDDSDFAAFYFFDGTTPLAMGDQVTLSAGVVTLPDFFAEPGATLPDRPVNTAQMIDRTFQAVSDPVLVPEPGASLSLTWLFLFVVARQRHEFSDVCN